MLAVMGFLALTMMGQYNLKRYRRVQKTWTFAAGGGDQIPLVGPFNELIWTILGTTDAFTLDVPPAGLGRWASQIQFISNKRGNLGFIDSMSMLALAYAMFNTHHFQQTVGGGAGDGCGGILPLGCDFDEIITMNIVGGTFADMSQTGDLAAYTGVLRCTLGVLNTPNAGTYWAYYTQPLGANGVIGIGAGFQQPVPAQFPGFLAVGEAFICFITNLQTATDFRYLAQVRTTSGDDALVDDFTLNLALIQKRHVFGGHTGLFGVAAGGIQGCTCIGLTRHIPVPVTDSFLVFLTNGAAATIFPSRMVYIYQGGILSNQGENPTKPTANVPVPEAATPQGHLQPNVSQPGVMPTAQGGYRYSTTQTVTQGLFSKRV